MRRLVRAFESFALAGITLCGCDILSGPRGTDPVVFEQVAAGGAHACAISAEGVAYCWGGGPSATPIPTRVNSSTSFRSLNSTLWSGTYEHDYGSKDGGVLWTAVWALARDGSLWTWDERAWDADGSPAPIEAPTFTAMVAGGAQGLVPHGSSSGGAGPGYLHITCGLTQLDEIHCYGDNQYGQLGTGSTSYVGFSFARVTGGHAFTSLPTGALTSDHMCALTAERQAYCWGGNYAGQLGATTSERCLVSTLEPPVRDVSCSRVPVLAAQGRSFFEIAVGGWFTCGLDDGGTVYCWGSNRWGELGRGTTGDRGEPAPVTGGRSFVEIVAASRHACALDVSGAAYCWGYNAEGQLGDGTTVARSVPVEVAGHHRFRSLDPGRDFTCGISEGGAVLCWGSGHAGQLGTGNREPSLVPVPIQDPIDSRRGAASSRLSQGFDHPGR